MQLDVQQADSACLGAPSELSKHDQSGTEHSIRPQREASLITEQRTKVVFFLANGTVWLTEQELSANQETLQTASPGFPIVKLASDHLIPVLRLLSPVQLASAICSVISEAPPPSSLLLGILN